MTRPALLVLQDGTVFRGEALGSDGAVTAEVVFNTAMTGYQEIATDPSYAGQIVTLTYPHIGNTGINSIDREDDRIRCAGLIVRDVPLRYSNWRAELGLHEWLQLHGVVAIAGIDTRRLTRILRERGAQGGCLVTGEGALDSNWAYQQAQAYAGMSGRDLAGEAGTGSSYAWSRGTWRLDDGREDAGAPEQQPRFKVVAYDFGVKQHILRLLVDHGCQVSVVPAHTSAGEVAALEPDGVFLSNGPGDPEPMDYAIANIRSLLEEHRIPVFGICLGHQLLGLASGARTVKMKFGHHGANHPVQELASGRVMISSQNHGFAVDEASLPDNLEPTHRSLFDGSLQGIRRSDVPAFGFQGHPEASPGPHDVRPLFQQFIEMMEQR
ncbi:carbamoyl-phosphate synthase small chain [Halorhodospira halochloris]|uniref:Carbamoyl phosphate synthase small chain n=1 Tax=Halorhodospira halochloris TaxID=1052 RepID=A0A0X8X933_HALHR|nr:glutamine-hydrolyzing carbamoyl-phosphate synthase small subunit [Halorhodospira halochloris]MBK1652345.1 carbamoyl-phosphate synthase small subunit [Halorhodospira halochloris]BAU57749.1 carbamoyl-phosphate synthase small chain [Halorhodospira halochloris]